MSADPRAHARVFYAVRKGWLVRPDTCGLCEKRCKVHGHHDDYEKPLEVRWLCPKCHRQLHDSQRPKGRRLVPFTLALTAETTAALREMAARADRPFNRQIRRILEAHVERESEEQAA